MTVVNNSFVMLAIACLIAAAVHVSAGRSEKTALAAVAKIAASTAFVLLAAVSGGVETTYGRFILVALVFSWIGDILLISQRKPMFLAGIAAFLFAHAGFAGAFLSEAISLLSLTASLIFTTCAGVALFRWLRPSLTGIFKIAVPIYIAVIMAMVSFAIAASAAGTTWIVTVGAIIFAVSDVFVARDRFLGRNFVNKLWGIPLYYIAQLLLAGSVAIVQR